MARQEINIFGSSFLDLLFGALAAVLILFIIAPKRSIEQQNTLEDGLFSAHLLPKAENWILSADDVNQLILNMQQLEKTQHFLVCDLIEKAYTKYRLGKSSPRTSEVADSQITIYNSEIDSEQAFIQYTAWEIPSVGFIETVLGIAASLGNEPYLTKI